MDPIWLYQKSGDGEKPTVTGPVSAEVLQRLLHEGVIHKNTLVKNRDDPNWAPLVKIRELRGLNFGIFIRKEGVGRTKTDTGKPPKV
jgi:hypothetical protein